MQQSPVPLPDVMPVMALPGGALFPNALLPLRIFEPRYREMLANVLAGDRIFAVGMVRPDTDGESIFPMAGAGLVRACVGQADGTSQLILQGLGRVRFKNFTQTTPYLIGRVTLVETVCGDDAECIGLHRQLREFCTGLDARGAGLPETFTGAIEHADDTAMLGDLVAHHLLQDPLAAQQVLAETHLPTRLKVLIAALHSQWQHFGN